MSNKAKFKLIFQSMFVLCTAVAMSVSSASAQNPYYSEAANSQETENGFTSSVRAASPFDEQVNTPQSVPTPQSVSTSPAVGQNADMTGLTPVYGAGYTTMPEYPRNNGFTPGAETTPDPPAEYPKTKEEMAPELIRRDPPLTPYDQQETYSYMTQSSTSSATACQLCNEGYGNPYMWQIGVGVEARHHGRMEKAPTMFYSSSGAELNANTSFTLSPGLNLTLTRYLGRNAFNYDIWAEIGFDGLNEWSAENTYNINPSSGEYSSSFVDVNSIRYNAIPGLNTWEQTVTSTTEEGETTTTTYKSVPITQHSSYDIDMNSAELVFQFRKRGRPDPLVGHPNGTWTRECQGGLSYTHNFGFSYINNKESLDWDGVSYVFSSTDDSDYTYIASENGYVHNRTKNNLVGAVIGGEVADKHCVWSWGMKWRLNPYLNFTDVTTSVSDGYSFSIDNTGLAYKAEWGIFATLKTGKYLKWRLGYDITCLGGTATAPKNMVYSPNDAVCDTSYTIYQTLNLKCSVVW